ncbi:MAG: hypothetical protein ACPG6P_06735 [Akkermansiaceae bacterium]
MQGSKQREQFSIQALQICDAFLVFVAFWIGDKIRPLLRPLMGLGDGSEIGLNQISWLLFIVVPFTPLILELFGFYRNMMRKTIAKSLTQMLQCLVIIGMAIGVMVVFVKVEPSSRIVLIVAFAIAAFLLLIRDGVVRKSLRKRAIEEGSRERVVVAGSISDIKELIASMPDEVTDYWHVVEEFDLQSRDLTELEKILKEHAVQRVVISARDAAFVKISRTVEMCEKQGIEAWVSAGFIRTQVSRPTFDNLGGKPMLVLRTTPELSWALLAKALMDRIGAFFFILFTSPAWLFAMIGIRLASPGAPVFFRQESMVNHLRCGNSAPWFLTLRLSSLR